MSGTLHSVFFSPTSSSKKIARAVAWPLSQALGKELCEHDLTFPQGRNKFLQCTSDDVFLFAFPVYAGRVPRLLSRFLTQLDGGGARAVVLAVYGNRHYDDALLEAVDTIQERNCSVVSAGALVAEHSLTAKVGTDRPDAQDLKSAEEFSHHAAQAVLSGHAGPVSVPGKRPYKDLPPAMDIRPKTSDACTQCLLCVSQCPMQIISEDDPAEVGQGCIRCCACVKACPEQAKFFDQEPVLKIIGMLEEKCRDRREPEFYTV
ncbi:MAG: 4Fe-4S ferredoxin [Desulfovibrio sp.]|uniref:4Fe-4S ferredoxin n=1 Tax=Desulfovibrio sp. TaxID=885 RepID=UPI0039E7297B